MVRPIIPEAPVTMTVIARDATDRCRR